MSPHTFETSPGARGDERKFVNPTPGFVGANKFGPDGKPTAIAVEPGGEVWLTAEEERMTAEAPRLAQDNPFVKEWEEAVEFDSFGEPVRTVTRKGTLTLSEEPPRPVASDRFIPERESANADIPAEEPQMSASADTEPTEEETAAEPEETVTGAPPQPEQPPVEGQPSPDEVVGTPEAVAANDEALAEREPTAEQPTREPEEEGAIPT